MKKLLICLLDKDYPPDHSFVDGMLAQEIPKLKDVIVILITGRNIIQRSVVRYRKAICLPILFRRSGAGRFINTVIIYRILIKLISKEKQHHKKVLLFIRNEPAYLITAGLFKKKVDHIIFQQSFPHEKGSVLNLKKNLAKIIFRVSAKYVDTLVAVSSLGLERLRKYFGYRPAGIIIPLASYHPESEFVPVLRNSMLKENRCISFIYTGTHDKIRRLDIIMDAIAIACSKGISATFTFIGGEQKEIARLQSIPGVADLENSGTIKFFKRITRKDLLAQLHNYDVGLSLIPPLDAYVEASPTKLAEYMYAGLAVLASKGILSQEEFIKNSKAGLLVDWATLPIADAIIYLSNHPAELNIMKQKAYDYSKTKLNYNKYIDNFAVATGLGDEEY